MKKLLAAMGFSLFLIARAGFVQAAPPSVAIVQSGRGMFRIQGTFSVAASSPTAWRVLSDYGRIGEFVSSVDSSAVKERRGNDVLVEQVNHQGFWLFHSHFDVLLKVRETPNEKIEFEDLRKKSFNFYRGSWKIEPAGSGTRVSYELEASHPSRMPSFVSSGFIRRSVAKLLGEVAAEIERIAPAP